MKKSPNLAAFLAENMHSNDGIFGGAITTDYFYIEECTMLLHNAVLNARIEIIFLLLELGANPFIKTREVNETAFELACLLNRKDIVSLFSHLNRSKYMH